MGTIMPKNEAVKKAVKWISSQSVESGDKNIRKLIDEAVFRFDLSPKDAEFVIDFFRNRKPGGK